MTPARRTYVTVLRVYAVMYFAFFFVVMLADAHVYRLLDLYQELLGLGAPSGGAPPTAVWKYVALGYIGSLGVLSVWGQADPERGLPFVQLMIWGKFLSGALMVGHFVVAGGVTAFLVAGVSDWAMGAVAWWALRQAFPAAARQLWSWRPLAAS